LYDQVKDGVADVTWTLPGTTTGRFPRIEVFELPFIMTNAEATSKAYWEYVQTYAKDEFKDVHLIAVNVHGPGMFHSASKPIKSIGDLKGMKVRGPTRQITKLLASLGATPVGMPLPGIPDALSKGVIDAAVIPWEVVPSVKVNELAKYHSEFDPKLPALYTTTFVMTMNKAKYDSLPPDLKKVIDNNSGIETSGWLGKVQQGNDTRGRATVKDSAVLRFSQADYDQFKKVSSKVDESWVKEMDGKGFKGEELLGGARSLIEKHSK
jgi:TRAP-type C4-dicarboxylate transport system substrate-binding protein